MDDRQILIAKTRQDLPAAQPKWVADWHVEDVIESSASPPQTLDGTIHIGNISQWIRLKLKFLFNFKNKEALSAAERMLLQGGFVCNFLHPVINKRFTGFFILDKRSIKKLLMVMDEYVGAVDYSIEAKSIYPYSTYAQLESLAENDSRF